MARGKQIIKINEKSVSECLAAFIRSCEIKNLSPRTIQTYQAECNYFVQWYGSEKSIRKVNVETIEDYILFAKKSGISQMYVATKIRQVRTFLYFCMEREYLENFKIMIPKVDEVIKEPYTAKELERLIKKPQSSNFVEWRTWAMINYFVATGNRLSTVINVKVKDLDFSDNLIKLNVVKNRKQQYIPMSSGLKQALRLYLSLWDYKESDYLFPEYEGGQLTARGAYDAIRKYNINRGVTKTSVHLFRHTFAKNYIIAGGDCTYLQRLLGHSTLTMTNHYLNLYSTDLQKNYDLFNPLDNLTKQSEKQ